MEQEIRAHVVNIRGLKPSRNQQYFVDTNVWSMVCASHIPQRQQPPEATSYSDFIGSALRQGSTLFRNGLVFSELASLIEAELREIHNKQYRTDLTKKEFRRAHFDVIRRYVKSSWEMVVTYSQDLPLLVNEQTTHDAVKLYHVSLVDPYDAFYSELAKNANLTGVVTHDYDLATVAGLSVITGNSRSLAGARVTRG